MTPSLESKTAGMNFLPSFSMMSAFSGLEFDIRKVFPRVRYLSHKEFIAAKPE